MWHETLFDELNASAYRCTKSDLWLSEYANMCFRSGICPGLRCASSRRSSRPLVVWGGVTPPHTLPHYAPSALSIWWGHRPQIFLSRTAFKPSWSKTVSRTDMNRTLRVQRITLWLQVIVYVYVFWVIDFSTNRKTIYDFLLVINCNLNSVSCRFTAKFITDRPTLVRGDPFEFHRQTYHAKDRE